jgi:HEAT repeat protein
MLKIMGVMFCVVGGALQAPAGEAGASFDRSQWIWSWPDPGSNSTRDMNMGCAWFRVDVTLPQPASVVRADVFLTADNLFALYVNGKYVGQSDANPNRWRQPKRFDVAGLLVPGRNVVAVEAANTAPGPAGLIVYCAVQLADGRQVVLTTGDHWKCNEKQQRNWEQVAFDDAKWPKAYLVAPYGSAPWGKFARNLNALAAEKPRLGAGPSLAKRLTAGRVSLPQQQLKEVAPPNDYLWPEAIIYLGDDCSLYRGRRPGTSHDTLNVTVFTARNSRSYPEHDLPTPIKMGRKLYALKPARPGTQPRLLVDAGRGGIVSPSVSFDGQWIYVAMAKDDEPFFHIYRMPAGGGRPQRLTDGPFHDIDPCELPDGRIVFTSTRIGTYEEYHNPPSRSLFTMNPDGTGIRPITHTFVFDNEAEVLADGRILFIRSDNFFDRGKVETLLHAVHPDGTEGYTEFGLDIGPDYGGRLRAFYCGSPAPMPDGQVAFVSGPGITVGRPGGRAQRTYSMPAGDVAALPDGRLLATVGTITPVTEVIGKQTRARQDVAYEKLIVFDPQGRDEGAVVLYRSPGSPIHSPVYLGARTRPPVIPPKVEESDLDDTSATGVLFCQNARFTKNTTAGWQHVRAIRVLAGKGLTNRSSHAYIVHAGSEVTELGTVPLAPDGSFAVEVPADTAIAFQAVDGEGRSELNEMSWIFIRPGEKRGCVGCHQTRQATPLRTGAPLALSVRPLRLLGRGQPHRFRGNNPAVTGLMELQFDRYREVAGINRHSLAVESLATGNDEVAALIAHLNGDDVGLKISSAQRLAVFRAPEAASALARLLGDDSREVRVAAAMALGACGTRESVPPLLAALSASDPLTRQAAAVALENLTGHLGDFNGFAAPSAREVQAENWRAWFAATNWQSIERDQVQRLQDPDRDMVRRAAVALGHIGQNAARDALRTYVAREREDNPYPEWRKSHRGDGARFNSLSPANPRTLQAATRSLGYLKDVAALPMLADTVARNSDPETANLFLAEAAVEAIGRIGTPEAQDALVQALAGLKDYFFYVGWYGDHGALYACHASPVHYFIAEALDHQGSTRAASAVTHLIRSVPTDPDRALLLCTDDCEAIVGRVIRRQGAEAAVVETCLAILGEAEAERVASIEQAIVTTYAAWAGKPDPENRAAQILSLVCRNRRYEPHIRAALERYRVRPVVDLDREGSRALPHKLPTRHWVSFFLARALGNLADPRSVDALVATLEQCPPEGSLGHPDPTSPSAMFLQKDFTPCYRAAAAWALGQIGDRRAGSTLLGVIGDLTNATDTRFAAAESLAHLHDPAFSEAARKLAADYPEVSVRKALLRVAQRAQSAE